MDALGFGLENYDAIGAWRTRDGKFPVDSAGTLPGGKTFRGSSGLKAILKSDSEALRNVSPKNANLRAWVVALNPSIDPR